MYTVFTHSQREALFNSPDLGDLKGGLRKGWDPSVPIQAPFFNTRLILRNWSKTRGNRCARAFANRGHCGDSEMASDKREDFSRIHALAQQGLRLLAGCAAPSCDMRGQFSILMLAALMTLAYLVESAFIIATNFSAGV